MEIAPIAAAGLPATPPLEPVQSVVERQLFDYLAEVEKAGAGQFTDPTALAKAAVQSLEGTMQQVQKALDRARPPAASDGDAPAAAEPPQDQAGASTAKNANDLFGDNAAQLLERSISVMWAASNLQIVTSSVTAVTSSVNGLIKQA